MRPSPFRRRHFFRDRSPGSCRTASAASRCAVLIAIAKTGPSTGNKESLLPGRTTPARSPVPRFGGLYAENILWCSQSTLGGRRRKRDELIFATAQVIETLAVPTGLEPVTFGLGNRCSIRLSYGTRRRTL